jgi:hypothetical protein
MNCTVDHSSLKSGEFCTSCGERVAPDFITCVNGHEVSSSRSFCEQCGVPVSLDQSVGQVQSVASGGNFLTSLLSSTKGKAILASAVAGVVLVGGLGAVLISKKSPAFPYLVSACAELEPVIFKKNNTAADEALASRVSSEIQTAESLDPEAAAAMSNILADFKKMNEDSARNNLRFSLMVSLSNYSLLSTIQAEIDRIIAEGERLEREIDIACEPYLS